MRDQKPDISPGLGKTLFLGIRGGYALGFLGVLLVIINFILTNFIQINIQLERFFGLIFIVLTVGTAVLYDLPILFPPNIRKNIYLSPSIIFSTLLGNIIGSIIFAFLLYFLGIWSLGGLEFISQMVVMTSQNIEADRSLLLLKGSLLVFFLCSTIGLLSNLKSSFIKTIIFATTLSICYVLKIDQLVSQLFLIPATFLAQKSIMLRTLDPQFTIQYVGLLSASYMIGGTLYMGTSYGFKFFELNLQKEV